MESELQILNNIEKNEYATQRDLARSTGMSLGNVNLLIKRLVKKGLVKIERLNAKTIRYILTPQGLKEKTQATYNYIVASYKFINDINQKLDEIIISRKLGDNSRVILFGYNDEICELIRNKFNHLKIGYTNMLTIDELRGRGTSDSVIIIWHPDSLEIMKNENMEYINVLDKI